MVIVEGFKHVLADHLSRVSNGEPLTGVKDDLFDALLNLLKGMTNAKGLWLLGSRITCPLHSL